MALWAIAVREGEGQKSPETKRGRREGERGEAWLWAIAVREGEGQKSPARKKGGARGREVSALEVGCTAA